MYENLDQLLDAFDDDAQSVETMAVIDAQSTMMLLAFNEDGELFYTRVPTEDDSPTGFIRDTEVRWPLRILRPATPQPTHGPGPLGDARRALAAYDAAGLTAVLQTVPTLAQSLRALIAAIDIDLAGAMMRRNCPACGLPASHCQWWADYQPASESTDRQVEL